MSEQRIVSTGSINNIVMLDEHGRPIQPSESLMVWLVGLNLTFVDRDGSKHSLPTEAHRGAIIMPTKKWDDLTPEEKESERKRWGGLWPGQD
jgi:hypothetical protein